MRYVDGLPCDNGSTDAMDSARLAGLLVLFNYPGFDKNLLRKYVQYNEEEGQWVAVRHPFEYPANNYKNFTRDQLVPLVSGLKQAAPVLAERLLTAAITRGNRAQNTEYDVPGSTKAFPNGTDWLSPSVMNHLRLCAGTKPTLFGKLWLIGDILFNAFITHLSEPNVLICMCYVAGPFYIKLLKRLNASERSDNASSLDKAITDYWCGWRNEPEVAEVIKSPFI